MLTRRSPSLIAIAIPTVLTAAAVYIALAFATRITGTLLKADKDNTGSSEIRPVGTSERRPFVEQTPPPSPEMVAARIREEMEASRRAAGEVPFPILDLEALPEAAPSNALTLEPLKLPSPGMPNAADLLPNGTTPSNSAEAK